MQSEKTYRVDWTPAAADKPWREDAIEVIYDLTREEAMRKARQISATKQAGHCAYAISRIRTLDQGARCYHHGAFSHMDGEF